MILRRPPIEQRGLMLTLCGALSAPLMGCISTGRHTLQAEKPGTETDIERFELSKDKVVVQGRSQDSLCGANGQKSEKLTVYPLQSFEARGEGCTEKWTLTELGRNEVTFDVRGRYYACTDLIGILFGTPTRLSHWTVLVQPSSEGVTIHTGTDWFRWPCFWLKAVSS